MESDTAASTRAEALLQRLLDKNFPLCQISTKARVARQGGESTDSIHHVAQFPLRTGSLAYHMRNFLNTIVTLLIKAGRGTVLDHFYMHWGYLTNPDPAKDVKCWFYNESELFELLEDLLGIQSNVEAVSVFLHFGTMSACFKPLEADQTYRGSLGRHFHNYTSRNYVGRPFLAKRHILAVLQQHAIARLASEERCQALAEYHQAGAFHLNESLFETVAQRGWKSVASCILSGISLVPLWILCSCGFDDGSIARVDYEKWAEKARVIASERNDSLSTSQESYMRKHISREALWLVSFLQGLSVASPHEWQQKLVFLQEEISDTMPILSVEPNSLMVSTKPDAETRNVVKIEPRYQYFSKDPEQLFILRSFGISRNSSQVLFAKFRAFLDHQHPFQSSPIDMWRSFETINFLYLAPSATLAVWMKDNKPTSDFLSLSLWENLAGIASALAHLHELVRGLVSTGWSYALDMDCILLFPLGGENWRWKLGNIESELLAREPGDDEVKQSWRGHQYSAPEFAQQAELASADTWSLGCMFLDILAWAYGIPVPSQSSNLSVSRFWKVDPSGPREKFISPWVRRTLQEVQRELGWDESLDHLGALIGMLEINAHRRMPLTEVVIRLNKIVTSCGGSPSHTVVDGGNESTPSMTEGETASTFSVPSFQDDEQYERAEIMREMLDFGIAVGITPRKINHGERPTSTYPPNVLSEQLEVAMRTDDMSSIIIVTPISPSGSHVTEFPSPNRDDDPSENRGDERTDHVQTQASLSTVTKTDEQTSSTTSVPAEADPDAEIRAKITSWWTKEVLPQLAGDSLKSRSPGKLLHRVLPSKPDQDVWAGLTRAQIQRCYSQDHITLSTEKQNLYVPKGPLAEVLESQMIPSMLHLIREVGLKTRISFQLMLAQQKPGVSSLTPQSTRQVYPTLIIMTTSRKERKTLMKVFGKIDAIQILVQVAHIVIA